jgi:hypothetical protein
MSRQSLGVAVVVAAALVAAPALATTSHLIVADTAPFTVRGTHFKPHEHVRVAVTTSAAVGVHTVIAGEAGGFLTRYTQISLGACATYTVRATGNLGSRATVRVIPECANGPTQ